MSVTDINIIDQSAGRDQLGHRDYDLTLQVMTDDILDGPEVVGGAVTALYPPGTPWVFGNDDDPWAFATLELTIGRHRDADEQDPVTQWIVTQKYTTKPTNRCNSNQIEDPLLEPYRISGGFNKETKERTKDKDGKPLIMPSFERIRGSLVERRTGLPTITIGLNVATLPHATFTAMNERVNSATLWGYPKRCIRLVDIVWSRKLYGTCYVYWVIDYTFEINPDTYDVPILAEGRKVLKDGGDATNPLDFVLYKEDTAKKDHPGTVMLKADGTAVTDIDDAYYLTPKIDLEANFLLLGIPSSI